MATSEREGEDSRTRRHVWIPVTLMAIVGLVLTTCGSREGSPPNDAPADGSDVPHNCVIDVDTFDNGCTLAP